MGGCCCCCASSSTTTTTQLLNNTSPPFLHYPVSEERQPLSPHNATLSVLSTALLVDTNLDTSVPDTYRPPPAPIPYDTYIEHRPMPSPKAQGSEHNNEVASHTLSVEQTNPSSTLEIKVKNLESDEINVELEISKEEDVESDDLKKSSQPYTPPLLDEEDACPICLEEYDEENPKIITKCDHHFHLACIFEWMERSDTCAVCDQEMVFSPTVGG